ncbi:MAG: hypothetical protein ACWA41_00395 [Putridiphycobacter sp.]
MTDKKFIEDQSEVRHKLQYLVLFQPESDKFDEIYIDPTTKQKWERYEFEFEDQINYGVGIRTIPYPSIEETIEIALNFKYPDEVAGASALLFELDRQGFEIRKPLLDSIEKQRSEILADRFETIYLRTKIYDKTNNRDTTGKKIEDIKMDSKYYIETANRAEELKGKIFKYNNYTKK